MIFNREFELAQFIDEDCVLKLKAITNVKNELLHSDSNVIGDGGCPSTVAQLIISMFWFLVCFFAVESNSCLLTHPEDTEGHQNSFRVIIWPSDT